MATTSRFSVSGLRAGRLAPDAPMIAALDIGTSKVVAVVARLHPDQSVEVMGIGTRPSLGVKRGAVVNMELTRQAIDGAVREAALMANCDIHTVYVGIAGSHIGGRNAQAVVAVAGVVSEEDVARVIDTAKSGSLPADHGILHILPQDFVVDDQDDIRAPVGMSAKRLEAHIHVISALNNAQQNIEKCVQDSDLAVDGMVLEQLASGYAVLTEDERELGVCVVDMGAGTTDIAVFYGGAIRYTATIPIAGDQVTNDIAMTLRTPTQDANELKMRYASALAQMVNPEQEIEVPGMGERGVRKMSRQTLAEVVEPRYDELFYMVLAELERSDMLHRLPAGIVLTGGAARIEGAVQLAESVFNMPVRLGLPSQGRLSGMADILRNPIYATAVGLLLWGQQELARGKGQATAFSRASDEREAGMVARARRWLANNF